MTDRFDLLADRLADRVAERILEGIAEMLDERDGAPPALLDATQAARYLGIDRGAVYAMAKDGRLPTIKLGDSDRPRLRFDPKALIDHLADEQPPDRPANGARRQRSRSRSDVELLPIREKKSDGDSGR